MKKINLFIICLMTLMMQANVAEAQIEEVLKGAEKGNAMSQVAAGGAYSTGTSGAPLDLKQALYWYQRAADQGDAGGQTFVAMAYEMGKGVNIDKQEAIKWYRKVIDHGETPYKPSAVSGLERLGLQSNGEPWKGPSTGLMTLMKQAEQGDVNSQVVVGMSYQGGVNGVTKDLTEALKWYRMSADKGYAIGQYYVGTFYESGLGVDVDKQEAKKWYQKVLDQGETNMKASAQAAITRLEQPEPIKEETTQSTIKKDENVYRGSADPLKGLNVSKGKEIASGNYYALIIGIDKYSGQWKSLNNAVNDAQALEKTLRNKYRIDKFYTLYDAQATRSAILNVLDNLVNTLTENDNVLIYFSGHGDFKKTMNKGYWIPVDAKTDASSNLISNGEIQTFLASIKSKHTLLISDACFSGDIFRGNTLTIPFEESDKYYSKVYNLISRQALTSGGVEPVMDGGKDGHSVFAYYLLKNLQTNTNKYFDIGQLYNNLKVPVVNNSDQTPHLDPIKNTGDEGGQFIFIKKTSLPVDK